MIAVQLGAASVMLVDLSSLEPRVDVTPGVGVPRLGVQLAHALDAEPGIASRHIDDRAGRACGYRHVARQHGQQILHDGIRLRLRDAAPCALRVKLMPEDVRRGV